MHIEGFGERGGFGRRPALVVIDMTRGFTDPESPLAPVVLRAPGEITYWPAPAFPR